MPTNSVGRRPKTTQRPVVVQIDDNPVGADLRVRPLGRVTTGVRPDKYCSTEPLPQVSVWIQFCTKRTRRKTAIVLSERLRKGIATHQHAPDFPAMVLLLSGNLLQKFSDVGMLGFNTPELLR